jgi:hypothetical protein
MKDLAPLLSVLLIALTAACGDDDTSDQPDGSVSDAGGDAGGAVDAGSGGKGNAGSGGKGNAGSGGKGSAGSGGKGSAGSGGKGGSAGTGGDGDIDAGDEDAGAVTCDTDNGGCGDPAFYTCTDHAGAAPTCADIDECAADTDGCSQSCANTIGGFTCVCDARYALDPDGKTCHVLKVLYLGDSGRNHVAIRDELVAAGIDITDASPFSSWDGASPDVNDFDVVVYLQGNDYDLTLGPAADAALSAWMLAGGAVVRSEWIAWQIGPNVLDQTNFDQYLPVQSPDSSYYYSAAFTVTNDTHPLTEGMPASWTNVNGGCTVVEALTDAVVVATTDLCGPALTYKVFGSNGGTVIHINDDFGEDKGVDPDPNTLLLLINAVTFGGL